jgi:hypothetical protein
VRSGALLIGSDSAFAISLMTGLFEAQSQALRAKKRAADFLHGLQ